MDLIGEVKQTVAENQRQPTGDGVLVDIDGCLHLLHLDEDLFIGEQLSQRLAAEQGWFEKLITHAPSVGTFYEDALRAIVSDVLPGRFKTATGFIFDTETRRHSRQIDILVYDDCLISPNYRRCEFVVIPPQLSISQSEVKKTLKLADVREIILTSVNSNFGKHPEDPPGCHRLSVFSYSCRSKTQRILEMAAKTLSDHIRNFETETISGHQVRLAMFSFVLPQFFFFDRQSYIETRLRPRTDGACDLVIGEYISGMDTGLGEYLYEMTRSHGVSRDLDERDFRTIPLRNVESETVISSSVHLVQKISMLKLIDYFLEEEQAIRDFRINGQRPHTVLIPVGTDISKIRSFVELKAIPRVSWLTAP